jgi:hypothetical protein
MKTKFNLCGKIRRDLKFMLLAMGVFYMFITTNGCKKNDNSNTNTNDSIKYSLNDLLGTWQRHSLVTTNTNDGFWIYGNIVNNEGSSTAHLILPNGHNLDTTFTGTGASMTSDGVVTTTSDPAAHSCLSSDKNLWVGTTKRDNSYTLVFDQKSISGTTYSSADFQGTWQIHYIVGGGDWTGWVHAVSVMDNTGNSISNTLVKSDGKTGASSGGTTLISSDGIITNGTVTTYNGFMSADKKLMVTTLTDGGGGGGLSVSQKEVAGTTYSNADLQGKWQMHDILVGSENWTEHGIMTIDAMGNTIISNMIRDDGVAFNNPGTIALSISTGGIITFGADFHGFMSSDKKLIIGTKGDATNAFSLVALQKMP